MAQNNKGGQIARNFRSGQIAESLAFSLCRPFMAMARIEQEEDFGIDFIGTLLRKSSKTYIAEQSCMIQAKISSSARFKIQGLGVNWLRQLVLPYFPLVVNRDKSEATLFTLNDWHRVIHISRIDEYVFVLDNDIMNDPRDSFFSLGDPLMTWNMHESVNPDFCVWAYSILKPAIEIETRNQRFASIGRYEKLIERNFKFDDRSKNNTAKNPPRVGNVEYQYAGNHDRIKANIKANLVPFAISVANSDFDKYSAENLSKLIQILSKFGVDTDQTDYLNSIIEELKSEIE